MPFPLHDQEPARASTPEELTRRFGDGLTHYQRGPEEERRLQENMRNAMMPGITELGDPSPAEAMFTDRYADVEHMPREVQGSMYGDASKALDRYHVASPPWLHMLALVLIVAGLLGFGVLFLGWWR